TRPHQRRELLRDIEGWATPRGRGREDRLGRPENGAPRAAARHHNDADQDGRRSRRLTRPLALVGRGFLASPSVTNENRLTAFPQGSARAIAGRFILPRERNRDGRHALTSAFGPHSD